MNDDDDLFFTKEEIETLAKRHPTPLYIYDERGIRENARLLMRAFSWAPEFKNYFAVKACPNPSIIGILKEEGCGADCSSLPELLIAERAGLKGGNIMFTSNDTPASEFKKAWDLGAVINLDDITMIPFLESAAGIPRLVSFRYNPGMLRRTKEGNVIGSPEQAKYGLTRSQLFEAYRVMKEKGVKCFGLHTMIVSNELNPASLLETANMIFDLAVELERELGIGFEFVNLGGGIGIPYEPHQKPVDLKVLGDSVKSAYEEKMVKNGLGGVKVCMENGRLMTGPYGYLVTRAIHEKHIYKEYIGVDACMANLMRPGMYGAYHHISVLGKEGEPRDHKYDVVGSLCENNDKFAIDRMLPKIEMGDLLAIHNAGAHGHSMGFNYNGKLKSAEFLRRIDGTVEMIRRAETPEDYFATLDFEASRFRDMAAP